MATHSSISCLGNPMDRGSWQATVLGVSRVSHDLATKLPYSVYLSIYEWMRKFVIGNVSYNYRGQEALLSVLSASWRTRKTSSLIQSKSKDLRTGVQLCKSWPPSEDPRIRNANIQGQDKMDILAWTKKANLVFLHLFVLFSLSVNPMRLTCALVKIFAQFTNSNADLLLKHSHRHTQK